MYYVYILCSSKHQRHYIGHTSNLENRLKRHNDGEVKSTKAYKPWQIVYTENFGTKQQAYAREVQIKSYKGGNAFKALLQ